MIPVFAQRERCLKLRGNLTQRQAAWVANVGYGTWCNWEDGTSLLPAHIPRLFELNAKAEYPHYLFGASSRKITSKARKPPIFAQREQCMAARGTLTQSEAASVVGYTEDMWALWEKERRCIPDGLLEVFRAAAKRKFPHYRSDVRKT